MILRNILALRTTSYVWQQLGKSFIFLVHDPLRNYKLRDRERLTIMSRDNDDDDDDNFIEVSSVHSCMSTSALLIGETKI